MDLESWSPWEFPCFFPFFDEIKAVVAVTRELATRGQLSDIINVYSGDGLRITEMRFGDIFSFNDKMCKY